MLLYALVFLVVIGVAFAGYTAFMVFGLRGAIDDVSDCLARIEAALVEEEGEGGGRRGVSIARAREMPDALEAELERRAQKPTPLA